MSDYDEIAATIRERTDDIESEKAEKQRIREEKRLARERKKRQQFIERMIAPVLLVISILVSALVAWLY